MAMAQIERGANRIYGVERDRPALCKYLRAATLAVCAGLPALLGFLVLVAGGPIGDSVQRALRLGPGRRRPPGTCVRWPLSLALTVFAVAVLFRHAPRRRQPGLSWLLFGAVDRHRAVVAGQPAAGRRTCGSATASTRPTGP